MTADGPAASLRRRNAMSRIESPGYLHEAKQESTPANVGGGYLGNVQFVWNKPIGSFSNYDHLKPGKEEVQIEQFLDGQAMNKEYLATAATTPCWESKDKELKKSLSVAARWEKVRRHVHRKSRAR